jgi:hypothetical protein
MVIDINAKQFFRIEVSTGWGHLIKEKKELTKVEEKVREAIRAYRDGIKQAWDIYTQDNNVVREAKKTLDLAIDEAYKFCLPEHGERLAQAEYEQATKLYFKTLYKVHRKFADTIGQIWCVFMKYMETSPRLTKKNT